MQQTEFFVISDRFLLFYHPNDSENQNFEKMKKKTNNNNTWRYYHFTHVYHKCQSYGVWFLRYGVRQNFLSFWTIFCPFTPLTRKIKILKKSKKAPGDIIILHMCIEYHDHMLQFSWETTRDGCNFYFSFWAIFCPFILPLVTKKSKLKENENKAWRYDPFTKVYQKLWSHNARFPRYSARRTDGCQWPDGKKMIPRLTFI